MTKIKKLLTLIFLVPFLCTGYAQDLSEKANTFLNTLTPELKAQTVYPLKDELRFTINFVPVPRKGPTFHDFSETQTKAALDLLRASVSEEGYNKATAIMELEKVLVVIEKQAPESTYRDPLNYHFLIFGDPSPKGAWGWRFEGHHCTISFAATDGKIISSTPSFFGTNPGIVNIDLQRGKEVLKQETNLGFALVNSLNESQLKKARFAEAAPKEIITGNNRKATPVEPLGISYKKLNKQQQKSFLDLLDVYVKNYELGFSKTLMDKITKAGIENLSFAWAGGLKPGIAQYYRIQGPMLLIEYDNIQNNANHVHTIVRDLTNDFAEDILREHYLKEHK